MSQPALSNSVALSPAAKAALEAPVRLLPPDTFGPAEPAPAARRDRIWELSSTLHCSIIGTCLGTGDLRALLDKLGDVDAKTASDHTLHGRGVMIAARRDGGGKFLQKLLDRRHAGDVKRFGRAKTVEAVRALWREALDRGDIPGAYWAVLTHPATTSGLVQDAFGDVHMLSHLFGRSSRVDLRRLAQLEDAVCAHKTALAEQSGRIVALTDDRTRLAGTVHALEARLAANAAHRSDADLHATVAANAAALTSLRQTLDRERAHRVSVEAREAEGARAMAAMADELQAAIAAREDLRAERDALEAVLSETLAADRTDGTAVPSATGRAVLYVGGRPHTVARLATFVARAGGALVSHDGGVEDHPTLLAGLISRADLVLFPVDCVSHDAAGHIKRACRDVGCRYVPLRSASLASAVAALSTG